jgi:hypothetical protein
MAVPFTHLVVRSVVLIRVEQIESDIQKSLEPLKTRTLHLRETHDQHEAWGLLVSLGRFRDL